MTKEEMLALLRADVVPALGCTEPVCVALCAAHAASLGGDVRSVEVRAGVGIYKNGMSAGIPNCDRVGLPYAAAIGAVLQNPEKGLSLLEDLTPERLAMARELVGQVTVLLERDVPDLYVRCTVRFGAGEAVCVIANSHTKVVFLRRNDEVLVENSAEMEKNRAKSGENFADLTLSQLRSTILTASEEELSFLWDGVEMNETLAGHSRTVPTGVGLADALRRRLDSQDLLSRIVTQVVSAAESRLDGCPLPTMSSSGAGTKGLVVILPVSETAKAVGAGREQTLRALAFAHLVNRYINTHLGKLSPMCTCVMAASTAAAAAMTWLLGGGDEEIGHAVRAMAGTVTGMICDGGKVGCALKAAAGSTAALLSALTAAEQASLRPTDGICAETPEQAIRNMARIGKSMDRVNGAILDVLSGRE